MPRWVALLRAINVGGHVVKMDALRAHFADMGFTNVETFIASGNVVFDTAARSASTLERRIEAHLEEALGYPVATFLRTPPELAAAAAYEPFERGLITADGALSVTFLKSPLDAAATAMVMALRTPNDELHVHGREVWWWRRKKGGESLVPLPKLERAFGGPSTTRNVTTVRKLAEKYAAGSS